MCDTKTEGPSRLLGSRDEEVKGLITDIELGGNTAMEIAELRRVATAMTSRKMPANAAAGFGARLREQAMMAAEQEVRGIGWALKQLYNGEAVTRRGWNGKGMFLRLQLPDAGSKMTLPYVYMVTADQQRVPWLCSQSDLLARDWAVFKVE